MFYLQNKKPEAVGAGSLYKEFKVTNLTGETLLLEKDTMTISAILGEGQQNCLGYFFYTVVY